ncbi:MAG: hypothetical protein M0005_04715 [Actinomycetota bacterium]|jgi:hypothetical protein|nr:hypothetical protein [Actinomycetota bacterium]
MRNYTSLAAAGPPFFLSAWLLMVFAGATSHDTGVKPFGYMSSMVVTIGIWLVVAPAIGAATRKR